MRLGWALCTLCMLAGAVAADPPPAPRRGPRHGSAEWRSIDRAITDYCDQTKAEDCPCYLRELHHRPPLVQAWWQADGLLHVDEDAMDVAIGATLSWERDQWLVIRVVCQSVLNPRF